MKPGQPDSASVGTSGTIAERFGVVTAIARSLPALTCGEHVGDVGEHHVRLARQQVLHRGRAALVVHRHPVEPADLLEHLAGQPRQRRRAGRREVELAGIGLRIARSARAACLTGSAGCTTTRIGTVATSDIGAKSFTGSQPSLAKNAGAVANEVAAISSV